MALNWVLSDPPSVGEGLAVAPVPLAVVEYPVTQSEFEGRVALLVNTMSVHYKLFVHVDSPKLI